MPSPARTFRFGVFTLRTATQQLYKGSIRVKLRPQAFQVLELLAENAGEVISRDQLRQKLWPEQPYVDFEHGLNTAVKELRGVLNDSAGEPRFIETLPRRGYRFVGQLQNDKPENPTSAADANKLDVRNIRAIAVLPLEDLSEDSRHEYFSDSMTEALINSLARIKLLRVISRTSAMQYKGAGRSLPEIAHQLKVDAVIEGSVLDMAFAADSFDLAVSLDVIEHLDDDLAALRELRRVVAPGGALLVTVPAYQWLWSGHDEINHHHRRYTRRTLQRAAEQAGWKQARTTYFNSLLLPAAIVLRTRAACAMSGQLTSEG